MKGGRPGEMRSAGKSAILWDNGLPNLRRQGTQAFRTLRVRAFPLTIQNFSRMRDKTCSLPPCPVFSWTSLMINSAMWESAGMMIGCFRSVLRGAFPIRPPTLKTPSIRTGFNEANLLAFTNRADLPVWNKLTSWGNENFWTHWTITNSDLLRSEALRGIDLGSGPTWCDVECLRPRRERLSKATNRLSRYQSEKWERTLCKTLVEVFRREMEATWTFLTSGSSPSTTETFGWDGQWSSDSHRNLGPCFHLSQATRASPSRPREASSAGLRPVGTYDHWEGDEFSWNLTLKFLLLLTRTLITRKNL